MKKITEEWLKAAKDDLYVIEKIITVPYLTHIVAFHSQQCIEKSLKAIMEEYEVGFYRIHHLERLFEVTRNYINIEPDTVLIQKLDKLYIDARYPGELGLLPNGKPDSSEAEQFYCFAQHIYETIYTQLKDKNEFDIDEFTPKEKEILTPIAAEIYQCDIQYITDEMLENILWMAAGQSIFENDNVWDGDEEE